MSNSTTIEEASADPVFIQTISDVIFKSVNGKAVNNASKIQKFTILPHDFSVNTDELTPTFKLKRSVVEKKYIDAIESMYGSKERYVPLTSEIAEQYAKNQASSTEEPKAETTSKDVKEEATEEQKTETPAEDDGKETAKEE